MPQTKHKTTQTRRTWAEEQARQRQQTDGGAYDQWLLFYLFSTTQGPDHGVEGDVTPPAGDAPGFTGDFAGDTHQTTQFDDTPAGDPHTSDAPEGDFGGSSSSDFGGGSDSGSSGGGGE